MEREEMKRNNEGESMRWVPFLSLSWRCLTLGARRVSRARGHVQCELRDTLRDTPPVNRSSACDS